MVGRGVVAQGVTDPKNIGLPLLTEEEMWNIFLTILYFLQGIHYIDQEKLATTSLGSMLWKQFSPIFGENIGVLFKNKCYDSIFEKNITVFLNKKNVSFFRKIFGRKYFQILTKFLVQTNGHVTSKF
jgi:hypothetical protein